MFALILLANNRASAIALAIMDTFPTPNQPMDSPIDDEPETLDKPAQTETVKNTKGFRIDGKNFILTFPQCVVKKEVAIQRIENKFQQELKGYIVCEEAHADGTPHLHVFLSFHKRRNIRQPDYFDFIADKHGNYQVCRSAKNSIQYVTKAGNYIAKGVDVEQVKKEKTSDKVARLIDEGKTLAEVKEEESGYFLMNKRKIEDYATWIE